MPLNLHAYLLSALLLLAGAAAAAAARHHASPAANATSSSEPVYLWPLPKSVSSGSRTLTVDPDLALDPQGPGGRSPAVAEAFQRYRGHVFTPWAHAARPRGARYDVTRLTVVVNSANDTVRSVASLACCAGCFRLNQSVSAPAALTFFGFRVRSWRWAWTRATPSTSGRPAASIPSSEEQSLRSVS